MFTRNFFYDNSQLNFGKHFSKSINLSIKQKKRLGNLIESIKRIRLKNNTQYQEQHRVYKLLGLLLALVVVIFAFEWKTYDTKETVTLQHVELERDEILDIPATQQPPPPAPVKMAVQIVEVANDEEIIEEIDIDLDIETNELEIIEQVTYEHFDNEIEVEEEEVEEIFVIVEKSPEPVGGLNEFYNFVSNEIKYPGAARRAGVDGRVFVQFVVNKDGSLTDFEVIKGIGLGCDEEAIRVLKKAPNWTPGKQRGKEVRVRMVLPIHFVLTN